MYRTLSAPLEIQWEVTPACNHRCMHCYNYWQQERPPLSKLTSENLATYDKAVSEIINNNVFKVIVTGGEPLLIFKDLVPFLERLRNAGITVHLNTNITLLTPSKAAILKKLNISILTSLPTADPELLDELTQSKNALKRIEKGIQVAIENGIVPSVNMVVNKKNLHDILNTAKLAKKLGVRQFGATKSCVPTNCPDFSEFSLSIEELRFMLKELLKAKDCFGLRIGSFIGYPTCSFGDETLLDWFGNRVCTAGRTNCAIGFDGKIRPCTHAPMIYGNIQKDGLTQSWNAMGDWRTDDYLPQTCNSCKLKESCAGGCRIEALTKYGELKAPDPYCDFTSIESVRSRHSPNNFSTNTKELIEEQNLKLNPVLKYRQEDFGGILTASKHYVPVNKELFTLILKKCHQEAVSCREISDALQITLQEAADTAAYLLSKSILQISVQKEFVSA